MNASAPLSAKIIRNALSGGLRYIFVAPIPFLMTPLILHKIGVAGYGTWAVFMAINGLTSLADLGLVGTVSKFVAEYYAHRDFDALSRLLNSGLALFLSIAIAIGSILWATAPHLIGLLFRASAVPNDELILLFRQFLILIVVNILTMLFSSVTTGLQRLDLTNLFSAVNVSLSALFSAILLLGGSGLHGLVYGYIAAGLLTVGAYLLTIRKLLPQVSPNPLHFSRAEAQRLFAFSLRLYVTQAAVAIHNQLEKLFLGMLVGVAPAGWYDIASDVSLKVRGAIGCVLSPVLPAASELSALGDCSRLRELYYRTHKYLALIGIPSVCYVVVISHRFVELWLGTNLTIVALPLSVLLIVNFLNLATGPGFLIFAGQGNLKPGLQSATLGLVVNIILSVGLIYKFGFPGAVSGTATSMVIASGYFVWLFHRQTRYPYGRLIRESYLKPLLCALFVLGIMIALHPTRDLSWFGLVLAGCIYGSLYSTSVVLSGFFDQYDWSKIEALFPVVRQVRKAGRLA